MEPGTVFNIGIGSSHHVYDLFFFKTCWQITSGKFLGVWGNLLGSRGISWGLGEFLGV